MEGRAITGAGRFLNLLIKGDRLLSLKIGDVIKAEVVEVISKDLVSIRVKGRVFEAKTEIPVEKGDILRVRVEGGGEEIRLRLVERGAAGLTSLKNTLQSLVDEFFSAGLEAEELQNLRVLIESIPDALKERLPQLSILERLFVSIEGLTGEALHRAILASGIFYESKLRGLMSGSLSKGEGWFATADQEMEEVLKDDLKGVLLSLKDALMDKDVSEHLDRAGIRGDELKGMVDRFLNRIEYYQLNSKLNDLLQCFIPLIWHGLRDVEFVFREGGRDDGDRRSCIIRLDLKNTGRLVVSIVSQDGRFYIRFTGENLAFLETIKDNLSRLESQFASAGLNLCGVVTTQGDGIEPGDGSVDGVDLRI